MNYKNRDEYKNDVPFSGYRFLVLSGIIILTSATILLSLYFYFKYKEIFFLILAILICLAGFSHIVSRITAKVVKYVYKKENSN